MSKPKPPTRSQLVDAVRALGFNPGDVYSLTLDGMGGTVTFFHLDEQGNKVVAPSGAGFLKWTYGWDYTN